MRTIRLDSNEMAPALARAGIRAFSCEHEVGRECLAALELLTSELVSNAVMYADAPRGSSIKLVICATGGGIVRVQVTDQGSGFRHRLRDPEQIGGGYGLLLVESESSSWGIDMGADGHCVWFEIVDQSALASGDVQADERDACTHGSAAGLAV